MRLNKRNRIYYSASDSWREHQTGFMAGIIIHWPNFEVISFLIEAISIWWDVMMDVPTKMVIEREIKWLEFLQNHIRKSK